MLGITQHDGPALADLIKRAAGPVLILGGDPAADPHVAAALGEKDSVFYIGTHGDETAGLAKLVLPGAMWAEKAGIFVNRSGRLQEFKQSVARRGNAREDWRILAELMTACKMPDVPGSLKAVRSHLAGSVAVDVDLNQLPVRGFLPGGEAR